VHIGWNRWENERKEVVAHAGPHAPSIYCYQTGTDPHNNCLPLHDARALVNGAAKHKITTELQMTDLPSISEALVAIGGYAKLRFASDLVVQTPQEGDLWSLFTDAVQLQFRAGATVSLYPPSAGLTATITGLIGDKIGPLPPPASKEVEIEGTMQVGVLSELKGKAGISLSMWLNDYKVRATMKVAVEEFGQTIEWDCHQ
jgi:hypothetical protein